MPAVGEQLGALRRDPLPLDQAHVRLPGGETADHVVERGVVDPGVALDLDGRDHEAPIADDLARLLETGGKGLRVARIVIAAEREDDDAVGVGDLRLEHVDADGARASDLGVRRQRVPAQLVLQVRLASHTETVADEEDATASGRGGDRGGEQSRTDGERSADRACDHSLHHGRCRARTDDLLGVNEALSQLS